MRAVLELPGRGRPGRRPSDALRSAASRGRFRDLGRPKFDHDARPDPRQPADRSISADPSWPSASLAAGRRFQNLIDRIGDGRLRASRSSKVGRDPPSRGSGRSSRADEAGIPISTRRAVGKRDLTSTFGSDGLRADPPGPAPTSSILGDGSSLLIARSHRRISEGRVHQRPPLVDPRLDPARAAWRRASARVDCTRASSSLLHGPLRPTTRVGTSAIIFQASAVRRRHEQPYAARCSGRVRSQVPRGAPLLPPDCFRSSRPVKTSLEEPGSSRRRVRISLVDEVVQLNGQS